VTYLQLTAVTVNSVQLSILRFTIKQLIQLKSLYEKECSSVYLLIFSDRKDNRKYKHAYIKASDARRAAGKTLFYYFIILYMKTFHLNQT